MLLAVIDLGSNSFKMTVAQWAPELSQSRPFRILHKERHPVQLGRSVFEKGRLSFQDMRVGFKAIEKMHKRIGDFGSPILRVVATSAFRDAINGQELVQEVYEKLGVNIEIISGSEEATLISKGLEWEFKRVSKGLLIDIGGGSTEVATFGKAWSEHLCKSFRMGSLRLNTQLIKDRIPDIDFARRKVSRLLEKLSPPKGVEKLIGSAGTIQSLGDILCKQGKSNFSKADLDTWIQYHFALPPKTIENLYSLNRTRASVLVSGAIVLSEVLNWLGETQIQVTRMTLRDGLLVDLVNRWKFDEKQILDEPIHLKQNDLNRLSHRKFLTDLEKIGTRFHCDLSHAAKISSLSLSMLSQMSRLSFDFSSKERKLLLCASYLHDVGKVVSYKAYQQHGAYIIKYLLNEILTDAERRQVSQIVKFHRKDLPSLKGALDKDLSVSESDEVRRLAALLRFCDGLDHAIGIDTLLLRRKKKLLTIELVQNQAIHMDIDKLKVLLNHFEQVFDVKVLTYAHPKRISSALIQ